MPTTQYRDNAGAIHEFQQEAGDNAGSEKRPVAGMPAAVRAQFTAMAANLVTLAGAIASGSMKVVLQASTAVIGKLAANAGVNIGTVDIESGTVAITGPIPAGANLIGVVSLTGPIPAGANAIGKLVSNLGVNIGTVDVASGAMTLSGPLPVGTNKIGDVGIVGALPAGSNAIGKLAANGGVNIGQVDLATVPTANLATIAADTTFLRSYNPSPVLAAGSNNIGTVTDAAPAAATVTTVAGSTTITATLAASNPARVGLLIVNNVTDSKMLYVKFGAAASQASWSVPIEPGGTYEMPRRYYTGIVTGMWGDEGAVSGDAHVTETA